MTSSNEQVLQEILTKIEERSDEIRCFCPQCGQMVMMKHDDINCPYGDTDCIHCGYKCPNCHYEWEDGLDHIYSDEKDLIKYNKMRFSV